MNFSRIEAVAAARLTGLNTDASKPPTASLKVEGEQGGPVGAQQMTTGLVSKFQMHIFHALASASGGHRDFNPIALLQANLVLHRDLATAAEFGHWLVGQFDHVDVVGVNHYRLSRRLAEAQVNG